MRTDGSHFVVVTLDEAVVDGASVTEVLCAVAARHVEHRARFAENGINALTADDGGHTTINALTSDHLKPGILNDRPPQELFQRDGKWTARGAHKAALGSEIWIRRRRDDLPGFVPYDTSVLHVDCARDHSLQNNDDSVPIGGRTSCRSPIKQRRTAYHTLNAARVYLGRTQSDGTSRLCGRSDAVRSSRRRMLCGALAR